MRGASEHALLIVKPDGVRHPEFPRVLERRLAELALHQVATRDVILSRAQARTFWREGDVEEYVSYPREGTSRAIVVRGSQATWKCRRLKSELRKAFHCTSYRNLIHSTEPGNEYDEQFRLLFPDLSVDEHGVFIDQIALVTPDRFDTFTRRAADHGTPRLAPVVTKSQAMSQPSRLAAWLRGLGAVPYAGILIRGLTMSGHDDLSVIMYLGRYSELRVPSRFPRELATLVALATNIGAVPVLLPGTEDAFLQPDVMASVQDCGVSGVVCYSPEYEMARTHRLRSAALSAGLLCAGGSNGSLDWGRNSVSEEMHGALAAALVRPGRG
ncbi:MAG: hypothetical protein OXC31_30520 [Spirochaetaceae bacterium]|nr:hypothetical protein [Spirochaetaceae bacterium]